MAESNKSRVFEQTYQNYLTELSKIDYLARAPLLGLETVDDKLIIPLYDQLYHLSPAAVSSPATAQVSPAVRVILCRYVLSCPTILPAISKRYMTYREFRDAGPLVSYFTSNTNKTIESHFSRKPELLQQRCIDLGGVAEKNETCDFSFTFHALPRIPVILNFNDADDMFDASCSILYHESAQYFLDMECLAMTGTLLAGKLLAQ
jgi:hypothetical protein